MKFLLILLGLSRDVIPALDRSTSGMAFLFAFSPGASWLGRGPQEDA
jgi:hypothetical protein